MTDVSNVDELISPQAVTQNAVVGPQAEGELAQERKDALDAVPKTLDNGDERDWDNDKGVFAEDAVSEPGDGDLHAQSGEDVQPVRTGPNPMKPSIEEVEAHRITHYPYRSWCRWCVWGKALGEKRHASTNEHTIRSGAPGRTWMHTRPRGIVLHAQESTKQSCQSTMRGVDRVEQ